MDIPFDPTLLFIGGRWQAPRDTLPLFNPSTGEPLARIARGTAGDVDAAVAAAQTALEGDWGRLTATERGRILMKMSALVLEQADDAGAAGSAGRGQAAQAGPGRCRGAGALPGVLRRRRRQGAWRDHPLRQRLHRLHAARAAWGDGPHRALELPDADHRPQRGRGARDGQRLCAEAGGRSLPDGHRLHPHRRAGRPAGRVR